MTMTEADADAFVSEWIEAWNSHDVERITSHYHDDVDYYSPFIARLAPGRDHLHGKNEVREYVASGLDRFPDLKLGPVITVAPGDGSVAAVYRSVDNLLAVETLVLDGAGLVRRAHCHYRRGD
jgi:SnoaL-like domain